VVLLAAAPGLVAAEEPSNPPAKSETFVLPSETASSDVSDAEIIATVDKLIGARWDRDKATPAKPATDGQWCRRVFLDVVGRVPTVAELDAFVNDRNPNKRTALVTNLLATEYAEEYARTSTWVWSNILIGRAGPLKQGALANGPGMRLYLRDSFLANKSYDRFVYEMLTATGTSRPGAPTFNGAVNFLADKLGGAGITAASLATARTSEIFMGVRLQCVQCHNHPFNTSKQSQYWEFNAFFRQAAALKRFEGGRDVAFVELIDQDFGGDSDDPVEADVVYEIANRTLKVAYPVFTDIDGRRTELPKSGYIGEVNRRQAVAKLIVTSQYFPKAMVNATWARFLGHGFTRPLDDFGPHNPPTNPELLDYLANQFRDSGYDIKRLITWVVLSAPYALDTTSANTVDDPNQGTPPLFSHFYERQMQPEELYESILCATEGPVSEREAVLAREAERDAWVANLVQAQLYVTENKETTTFDGSIPQALMMFNGELTERAIATQPKSFLHRLASDETLSNLDRLNHLFMAALARKSEPREQQAIRQVFVVRKNELIVSMQDVWWSLLNTNEFLFHH
jgi:hypothetical protein